MSIHPSEPKAKIAILFYSMYGHIKVRFMRNDTCYFYSYYLRQLMRLLLVPSPQTLAHSIKEGVDASGAEGVLLQIPETLPGE